MSIYDELVQTYPTQSKEDLYNAMGGDWPNLINNPNVQNTCAIRLSIALIAAGHNIDASYREGITGDGRNRWRRLNRF